MRRAPLSAVLATNSLGLGGTQKGLVVHALSFDPARVSVRVVAVQADGPRSRELRAAGIPVACAGGDGRRLAEQLAGADVVHVFRSGAAEPLVPSAVRTAGVPVLVETNVFGQVDSSPDERDFGCHLFVSKMCALRYRRRLRLDGPEFHDRHRVSPWPIDLARLRALAPSREEARLSLGLDPVRPVVGRIGRDDDRKWRSLLPEMVPRLLRLVPEVQVLLVGVTPAKVRLLDRLGVLDRVRLVPPSSDEALLASFYAASDVVVSAAEIGESSSVAIAEAMGLGRPVVTSSTPWVDNGQIEQVDEGENGHVADHPQPFAEAVAGLLLDAERRERFGRAAAAKADRLWDAVALTRQLEGLYEALAAGGPPPAAWLQPPAEVDAFAEEYERRLARAYRPLTPVERRQSRRSDLRERAAWALRAAQGLDRERAAVALRVVHAKLSAP